MNKRKIKKERKSVCNTYVVVGCCRGVDWMTVVVGRGFDREVLAGMASDSLSVDGDRAEEKNEENRKFTKLTNLNVYRALKDVE